MSAFMQETNPGSQILDWGQRAELKAFKDAVKSGSPGLISDSAPKVGKMLGIPEVADVVIGYLGSERSFGSMWSDPAHKVAGALAALRGTGEPYVLERLGQLVAGKDPVLGVRALDALSNAEPVHAELQLHSVIGSLLRNHQGERVSSIVADLTLLPSEGSVHLLTSFLFSRNSVHAPEAAVQGARDALAALHDKPMTTIICQKCVELLCDSSSRNALGRHAREELVTQIIDRFNTLDLVQQKTALAKIVESVISGFGQLPNQGVHLESITHIALSLGIPACKAILPTTAYLSALTREDGSAKMIVSRLEAGWAKHPEQSLELAVFLLKETTIARVGCGPVYAQNLAKLIFEKGGREGRKEILRSSFSIVGESSCPELLKACDKVITDHCSQGAANRQSVMADLSHLNLSNRTIRPEPSWFNAVRFENKYSRSDTTVNGALPVAMYPSPEGLAERIRIDIGHVVGATMDLASVRFAGDVWLKVSEHGIAVMRGMLPESPHATHHASQLLCTILKGSMLPQGQETSGLVCIAAGDPRLQLESFLPPKLPSHTGMTSELSKVLRNFNEGDRSVLIRGQGAGSEDWQWASVKVDESGDNVRIVVAGDLRNATTYYKTDDRLAELEVAFPWHDDCREYETWKSNLDRWDYITDANAAWIRTGVAVQNVPLELGGTLKEACDALVSRDYSELKRFLSDLSVASTTTTNLRQRSAYNYTSA